MSTPDFLTAPFPTDTDGMLALLVALLELDPKDKETLEEKPALWLEGSSLWTLEELAQNFTTLHRATTKRLERQRAKHGLNPKTGKPMDRKQREALAWKLTHKDFKSTKSKLVMTLRNGGTCLVPLSALTEEEIQDKLGSMPRF